MDFLFQEMLGNTVTKIKKKKEKKTEKRRKARTLSYRGLSRPKIWYATRQIDVFYLKRF